MRLTTWDVKNPVNNGIFNDIYHINWCMISSINRSDSDTGIQFCVFVFTLDIDVHTPAVDM